MTQSKPQNKAVSITTFSVLCDATSRLLDLIELLGITSANGDAIGYDPEIEGFVGRMFPDESGQ
jgi:hypothetical protein